MQRLRAQRVLTLRQVSSVEERTGASVGIPAGAAVEAPAVTLVGVPAGVPIGVLAGALIAAQIQTLADVPPGAPAVWVHSDQSQGRKKRAWRRDVSFLVPAHARV